MLFASVCVSCGRRAPVLCPACRALLLPAPALDPPAGLDDLWALLSYEGVARQLVHSVKYRARRAVLSPLGEVMAHLVDDEVDLVTWLPATRLHRRERGYDQAQLLARAVGGVLGAPCLPLLHRGRDAPQTGRSANDRAGGPALRSGASPTGLRVLVVDDVVTTGSSMRTAAVALRTAGAGGVSGLALARTPLKAVHRSAEGVREQSDAAPGPGGTAKGWS